MPDVPPGPDRRNVRYVRPSPDGRFLAVARFGTPQAPAPFRLFEAASGKAVLAFDWAGGSVHFTADSARVLVADARGPCRWFQLPSGRADGEWRLPPPDGRRPGVTALSDDGGVAAYSGPPLGPAGATLALLKGRTGEVLWAFGPETLEGSPVALSADGRLAAAARAPAANGRAPVIELLEADGGSVVGRATVPAAGGAAPAFALSPDGRTLFVYSAFQNALLAFEVPEPAFEAAPKKPEAPRRGRRGRRRWGFWGGDFGERRGASPPCVGRMGKHSAG